MGLEQDFDQLLLPDHFDWAEDVESIDPMLQPDHFDWAEDVESIDQMLRPDFFDWAEDVENIDQLLLPDRIDWAEEVENTVQLPQPDRIDWAEDAENPLENIPEFLPQSTDKSEYASQLEEMDLEPDWVLEKANPTLGPLVIDGSCSGRPKIPKIDSLQKTWERELLEAAVQYEHGYQKTYVNKHGLQGVHHFNWFGDAVERHSSTPPEISLLFLLLDPKVFDPRDELRLGTVMTRARVYIDPVIVHLENDIHDLNLKPFDLVRFAVGRTFKFYSPHGWWAMDTKEHEEMIEIDSGDVDIYTNPKLASGNGFVEFYGNIRSRDGWAQREWEVGKTKDMKRGDLYTLHDKMRNRVYKPSPLRQMVAAEELEGAEPPTAEPVETGNSHENAWLLSFLEREGKCPILTHRYPGSFEPHLHPILEPESWESESNYSSSSGGEESDSVACSCGTDGTSVYSEFSGLDLNEEDAKEELGTDENRSWCSGWDLP